MRITFQFVTEQGFQSWLIRRLTWSYYSHVDLVLPDEFPNDWEFMRGRNRGLLGAHLAGGVAIRRPDYGKFIAVKRMYIEVPGYIAENFYQWILGQVGKPYDLWAIFNMAVHRSHEWRDESRWFCSELQVYALWKAGVRLLNTPDCDRISPRDMMLSPMLREE